MKIFEDIQELEEIIERLNDMKLKDNANYYLQQSAISALRGLRINLDREPKYHQEDL